MILQEYTFDISCENEQLGNEQQIDFVSNKNETLNVVLLVSSCIVSIYSHGTGSFAKTGIDFVP